MEEVDARAVLRVSVEAPDSEVEAAYRKRVAEVRKSFAVAKDDRTKRQLTRELASLETARDILLAGPVDVVNEPSPIQPEDQIGEGPPVAIHGDLGSVEPRIEPKSLDELMPGKTFAGRFKLQRELSNDGTGAIWLAEDTTLQLLVDLKFLPDALSRERSAIEDLQEQLQPRTGLKHPNIATVYPLVEDNGRAAVSTEHVDGSTLSQLQSRKPNRVFEVKELQTWIKELCGVLEHLHKEASIIHGNIKPDHFIINPVGSLRLKDSGIARQIGDTLNRLVGLSKTGKTLAHSSPQQARGEKLSIADDIYSLGASIYEMVTGKPPFYQGDILAQLEKKVPPSMADRRAELGMKGEPIPKNWEETVAACLEKLPSQRPKSPIEVIRRLEKLDPQPPDSSAVQPQSISPAGESPPSPVELVSPPGKEQSTPVQPVFTVAKPAPATVVPDLVSAKPSPTPITPVSPPAKPPQSPVGPVSPGVGRVPPPVHPALSSVKTPQTPIGSILPPARPPQKPFGPAPTPAKRPPAPLISFLRRWPVLFVGGIIFVLMLASLVTFFWPHSEAPPSAKPGAQPSASGSIAQAAASPLITASPVVTASPTITASPPVTASPTATPSAEASTMPSPKETATPNDETPSPTPLTQPEIDATKQEVIKRINAAPGYTAEEKANLIKKMERARTMERLSVVRFDAGQTALKRSALDRLVKAFDRSEIRDKLSDQTIILVVAGYADTGGRAEINLGISQERAEMVAKILRRRIKLTNPMQTIGMGGTEILSNKRPDQNRAVEIWAVTVL